MKLRWNRVACAAALSSALLAGCAGNGIGLDSSGRPLAPGGGGSTGALTPDFASIQDQVFTPICTVCHAGGGAPQGLRLDATNSYALLVGVPSTEVRSILRVKPGDPDNSYIIQKLEGHAAVGAQMPFGGPPLPAATIAVIRQWISDGAPRAAAAAVAKSFAAVMTVPASGDVVIDPPTRIFAAFNQELDATRIDASSVRLERIDGAGESSVPDADASSAVPVSLAMPAGNPQSLMIVPARPLADGTWRLTATAPPDTGVASISGERLGGVAMQGTGTVLAEFTVRAEP